MGFTFTESIHSNICSIFAINKSALIRANVTHIVSVIRLAPAGNAAGNETFAHFQHLQIPVDDDDDENLLEHFPKAVRFIQSGQDSGGSVLVHWLVLPTCIYCMHK